MKVYLSGPIFTADTPEAREATDGWRNKANHLLLWIGCRATGYGDFVTRFNIQTIDPCRKKAIYDPKLFTPNEIILRDLKDVQNADIILAYINLIGDKLPIGTSMEIMYAYTLGKPVIIVSTDPRITEHPWIIAMSARIFSDLDTACNYIAEFWT